MNILCEVAKKLEIEMGVPFQIKKYKGVFILDKNGLKRIDNGMYYFATLGKLITGILEVAHKPWKPKYNEKFYIIVSDSHIDSFMWENSIDDILNYKIGNCFKTEEEAKQNKEKILYILNSDKMLVEVED